MKKLFPLFLFLLFNLSSLTADTIWTGAINSNWWVPSNWTAGVPSPGNNAIIPVKAMYTHDPEINNLVPAAFHITNSGCLWITNSGILNILAVSLVTNFGTINNSGIIDNKIVGAILNDGGTINNLPAAMINNENGGRITNINTGTINIDGMGSELNNKNGGTIINSGAGTMLVVINKGHIINSGVGATFNNQAGAKIEINDMISYLANSLGATLTNSGTNTTLIAKNMGDITNRDGGSILKNEDGAKIEVTDQLSSLRNSSNATLTNTGANTTLIVKNEGIITNIYGSTLNNEAGAKIEATYPGSFLNNRDNGILINTGANTSLVVKNEGEFINYYAQIKNEDGAKIEISDPASYLINTGNTITCTGSLTTILVTLGGIITNKGIIRIEDATLHNGISGIFENRSIAYVTMTTGSLKNASLSTLICDGSITGKVENTGGLIKGGGTINGEIISNGGKECPGNSPGIFTINGVYTHSDSSTYVAEIESNAGAGTGHDQFQVDSVSLLNGTLEVILLDSFMPVVGDNYDIMTYNSRSGAFDTLLLPVLTGGNSWAVNYNPADITLEVLAPLPVELTYFHANKKGNTSLLKWQTASEINNDHFAIEYSLDGRQFKQIGEVGGRGTSVSVQDYSFIHPQPASGDNYYRLRQVDLDGNFNFSIVEIVAHHQLERISVYPTLARDYLLLSFHDPSKSEVSIELFDVNGRQMEVYFTAMTDRMLQANIAHLEAGYYVIRVIDKGEQYSVRFVKM